MGAPKIGLDKVYVASLTTDDGTNVPTYGTPVLLAGAAKMTGNPNGTLVTDWGDNGPFFTMNARGNLQASMELIDIDPAVLAAVLGQTRANGITQEGILDQAPYYAVGFRVWIGGLDSLGAKIYEYFWYLKGKFTIPEQGAETKKETISPQHTTLSAEFVKLAYNDVMCVHGRTDYSLTTAAAAAWFNQPVTSASASLTAVTVGTIVGSASAHTITIPFAKSGETFSLATPAAGDITVSVVSTGSLVAGTYTYTPSAAGTAPSIVIYNANISGVAYLVSVTSDVVDNNGVHVTALSQLVTPAL